MIGLDCFKSTNEKKLNSTLRLFHEAHILKHNFNFLLKKQKNQFLKR